jgi:hypothetical protein
VCIHIERYDIRDLAWEQFSVVIQVLKNAYETPLTLKMQITVATRYKDQEKCQEMFVQASQMYPSVHSFSHTRIHRDFSIYHLVFLRIVQSK